MTVRIERVGLDDVPWVALEGWPDRTVFQTREWLDFLAVTQAGEPVVAAVRDGAEVVGWFTGARVRRFGLGVLGSPLRGWTTAYQGFNLDPVAGPVPARDLLDALARFGAEQGCRHVEVMDRRWSPPDLDGTGWATERYPGWELDLRPSEDDLLAATSSAARRALRKAAKSGLVVVRAAAPDGFAATFHGLLREVFARRGATVTYPASRVQALIDHLGPAGRLLLLEVRDSDGDGDVVAAGVFPGLVVPGSGPAGRVGTAYYWGGASRADALPLRPNDALLWAAAMGWKERGATAFDFGGGGTFKEKFGGRPIEVAWARRSRPAALEHLRGAAAWMSRRQPT